MLKFQYKDISEIPEGMESFYEEQEDGSFTLKIDGAVDKRKLDEFRTNNKALMGELETYKESLGVIKSDFDSFKETVNTKYGDIDLEAYNEMKANERALREQTLIEEGKHKELLAIREDELRNEFAHNQKQLQSELDKARKESARQAEKLNKQLSTLLIDNKLTALATTHGVQPTALEDVIARGKGTWRLEEGQPIAYDGNGNKMYASDGTSLLDMDTWMQNLSDVAPHLFGTSNGSGDDLNIDEWLDNDPDSGNTPDQQIEPGHEYMVGPLADIKAGLEQL